MAYSPDGIAWTAIPAGPFGANAIYAVACGGGRFVAGYGYGTRMAYSNDGIIWEAVTDPLNNNVARGGNTVIAYGNGRFVAADGDGMGPLGGSFDNDMWFSEDGINWKAIPNGTLGGNWVAAIPYGGGRFIAVGSTMAYSNDGINWSVETAGRAALGRDFVRAAAFGGGRFVAGGNSGIAEFFGSIPPARMWYTE
jgi:hypothetical protein